MTYRELHTKLQEYMCANGWIQGYITSQQRQACIPCNIAVDKCTSLAPIFLKPSTAAGEFYDIFSAVAGHEIRIGSFGNNGTVGKQPITVRFLNLDKYGDLDVTTAFLMMAKDLLVKQLDKNKEKLLKKEEELAQIKEARKDIEAALNSVNAEIERREPDAV